MVQTASLAPPAQAPRLSQLLPTVKCSSCSQPVPLADLSGHVCPAIPTPPPPSSIPPPPKSPKPPSSFLPQRFQNLVSRANMPARKSSLDSVSSGPVLPAPSTQARLPPPPDPFQRQPPPANTPRKVSLALPPTTAPPRTPSPTQSVTAGVSLRDRVSVQPAPAEPAPLERVRSPSNAHKPPSQERDTDDSSGRHSIAGRSRAPSLARKEKPPPPQQPPVLVSILRNNTPSLPTSLQPRSSPERTRTPSTSSRPSFNPSRRPSVDAPRPSVAFVDRNISSSVPPPASSTGSSTVPFPSLRPQLMTLPAHPPVVQPSPPLPVSLPRSPVPESERDIDTKCGGAAGMAGVGRRGFAAAARAAMLAASLSSAHHHIMNPSADGRRANAPRYLDINATMSHVLRASGTPPLSPNSGYTPSPVSPFPSSPTSPAAGSIPTSVQYSNVLTHNSVLRQGDTNASDEKIHTPSSSPTTVRIASPSRTPSPSIPNPFERRLSGETVTQSPMHGFNMRLPLLDMLEQSDGHDNESDDESVYTSHTSIAKMDGTPLSPSGGSEVGLAYADDSDEDMPVVVPLNLRKSNANMGNGKIKFPTMPSPDRNHSVAPSRKTSAASLSSASSSRSTTTRSRSNSSATHSTMRSAGALERAMETLIEEGASISVLASGSVLASLAGPSTARGASGKPNRSNTVPGPASPENKAPKLPTRSHTNPSHPHVHSERVKATGEVARIRNRGAREDRICARCSTKIEDGRWIQTDGGGVLCERCWKNMYLPKCRHCNLPIEKQAVSSRDGQLKGKYHKDCFNCHTCHKPFPDKEFYVFDGKPFCAYHYHEANDSLCAAISCGQPIEGPCAVNHAGRRYHPEHLLCEYGGGCMERLVEYWEVDGQMLCERHCGRDDCSIRGEGQCDSIDRKTDEGRARKRMTRFIDLGAGDDGDVDIR
ncbi:hypothetical protein V8B97DRAFT_1866260 [Scleroderma yunnanense]